MGGKVGEFFGVALDEMRSGSRRPGGREARGEMSRAAVQLFGYCGAKVARYPGVTNSCVSRAVFADIITEETRKGYGK